MRISDWSSDVCSSDLAQQRRSILRREMPASEQQPERIEQSTAPDPGAVTGAALAIEVIDHALIGLLHPQDRHIMQRNQAFALARSEEHTSELQSLMRHSYAVFCLKKKKKAPII